MDDFVNIQHEPAAAARAAIRSRAAKSKKTKLVLGAVASLALVGLVYLASGTATRRAPRADVVFVLDVTGSMGGEIDDAKRNILAIGSQLQYRRPPPDVRFGAVFYRDVGDRVPVRAVPLTRDLEAIRAEIDAQHASGGGDTPEHVGLGLHAALDLAWDEPADVRLIYLVGDAPAHHDYDDGQDVATATSRARDMRVKIHAVACQRARDAESAVALEFARIANDTGGELIFLERTRGAQRAARRPGGDVERGGRLSSDVTEDEDEYDDDDFAEAAGMTADLLLLDVTPLSIGVEVAGGRCEPVVRRNSVTPTRRRVQLAMTADSPAEPVVVRVFEGESPRCRDNHLLATLELAELTRATPRGGAAVDVAVEIDANGVIAVEASDASSGAALGRATVAAEKWRLGEEDIERMLLEAEERADSHDGARRAWEATLEAWRANMTGAPTPTWPDAAPGVGLVPVRSSELSERRPLAARAKARAGFDDGACTSGDDAGGLTAVLSASIMSEI